MNVYLREQKGRDNTIDPYYSAQKGATSGGDIDELKRAVQELTDIVKGKEGQEGIEDKLVQLEEAIAGIEATVDVEYRTSTEWNSQPELVAELGKIYVYSDAKEYEGQIIPRIKIGNGVSLLKDLPYADQDLEDVIKSIVKITDEDIENWNNKVSVDVNDESETLTFNN